jgi:purine-binding chemotaxis protein CheW
MSEVVAIRVAGQDFGLPVIQVRDVLRHWQLTPVPLAPRAVAGLLNLRGHIVTAIDLRLRLGLPSEGGRSEATLVVVENGSELYALVVDRVGDVLRMEERRLETAPVGLDPGWRAVASAVYTTDTGFIVLLDIARLLDIAPPARRAAS